MPDGDIFYFKTEFFARDLGQSGFHTLPVVLNTDTDFKPAIGHQTHLRLLVTGDGCESSTGGG